MNVRNAVVGGAAALFVGASASTALSEPVVFDVLTTNVSETGFTEEQNFIGHEFGTTETSDFFFPITISSGLSDRDDWTYQLVIDYTENDLGFFGNGSASIEILNIKGPDDPMPIIEVQAKDAQGNPIGQWEFDGGNIFWAAGTSEILESGEIVVIQWNQIPAPGALALLGIAGLCGARRRRS